MDLNMCNLTAKKISKIDKIQNLIKLYSDKKLSGDIVNDYLKELKDFDSEKEVFSFDLIPDSTYCKAEVVPSPKGVYSINLSRYSSSLNPESLKVSDIEDIIHLHLNENKILYYKKVLSLIEKDSKTLKKMLSDFYFNNNKSISIGVKNNKLVKEGYIYPFVTLNKCDESYKNQSKDMLNQLNLHIISDELKKSQMDGLSVALLEKRISEMILSDIESIVSFQKEFKYNK